jgi:hypothetical protein
MKTITAWISLSLLGSLAGSLAANTSDDWPNTPLFRCHFAGQKAIAESTNGATARAIASLPATQNLLKLALDRLAITPARLWPDALPKDATNQIPLLRPLLSDLLTAESWTQWRALSNHWEWATALRLNPEQTQRWNTNLWQLLSQWQLATPQPRNPGETTRWEVRSQKRPFYFLWATAKDWVILEAASRPGFPTSTTWLDQVGTSGQPITAPDKAWLDVVIDCPRLLGQKPFLGFSGLPHMRWTLEGDGARLKTRGEMTFAQPLNLSLEPWLIPTNLINDPLVSFAVARGIQPLLRQSKALAKLGLTDLPNQVCIWGQPTFYGQTLLAAPMAHPSNQVTVLAQHVPGVLQELFQEVPGHVFLVSNRCELVWKGLPIIVPFANPAFSGAQSYLLAGLVPVLGKTTPPPPELFAQIGDRKDLVYYGWEITEQRLIHHRHYYQLATILAKRKGLSTNDLSFQWLQDIHKQLGNTITEITQPEPRRLVFIRRSHLSLTGIESVFLARWIESPGFPLTFEVPQIIMQRPGDLPEKKTTQ